MILSATRGKSFTESFDFKNEKGQLISAPAGRYNLVLQRGDFVQEFNDLRRVTSGVVWSISDAQLASLPHSTMYFVLYFNGEELSRGVLRVS